MQRLNIEYDALAMNGKKSAIHGGTWIAESWTQK
jgi:hypothetical protein